MDRRCETEKITDKRILSYPNKQGGRRSWQKDYQQRTYVQGKREQDWGFTKISCNHDGVVKSELTWGLRLNGRKKLYCVGWKLLKLAFSKSNVYLKIRLRSMGFERDVSKFWEFLGWRQNFGKECVMTREAGMR